MIAGYSPPDGWAFDPWDNNDLGGVYTKSVLSEKLFYGLERAAIALEVSTETFDDGQPTRVNMSVEVFGSTTDFEYVHLDGLGFDPFERVEQMAAGRLRKTVEAAKAAGIEYEESES